MQTGEMSGPVIDVSDHPDLENPTWNSDWVKLLQRMLTAAGFSLADDGDFGDVTEAAVRAFQLLTLSPVTGKVDHDVWYKLYEQHHTVHGAVADFTDDEVLAARPSYRDHARGKAFTMPFVKQAAEESLEYAAVFNEWAKYDGTEQGWEDFKAWWKAGGGPTGWAKRAKIAVEGFIESIGFANAARALKELRTEYYTAFIHGFLGAVYGTSFGEQWPNQLLAVVEEETRDEVAAALDAGDRDGVLCYLLDWSDLDGWAVNEETPHVPESVWAQRGWENGHTVKGLRNLLWRHGH